MNTEQLRQFIEVARTGSVTAASKALAVSQPALSRSIMRLESELGCKLLERTKNSVSVTPLGLIVADHAENVLAAERRLKDAVEYQQGKGSIVRIATCAPAPLWMLSSLIGDELPGTLLSTETLSETEIRRKLLAESIDIALMLSSLPLPGFRSSRMFTEDLYVSVPIGHRLADKKAVHFADLDGETFALAPNTGFWLGVCQDAMPHATFLVQQDVAVLLSLRNTTDVLGFTTNYSTMPHKEETASRRLDIPIEEANAHATYYLVTRDEQPRSLAALIDSLHKSLD